MSELKIPYLLLLLVSVFLSSISQVLLKKAALRPHKNMWEEYTDVRVIIGYLIFFGCTLLTMLSYRGVPYRYGPVFESTGYIYVTFFGSIFFQEKITRKKLISLAMIVTGIVVFAL